MKIDITISADRQINPANEAAVTALAKLKYGEFYTCDIKLNQNYRLHQKIFGFFAFCTNYYYGDMDAHKDKYQLEYVRRKLTLIAGYYTQVFARDGVTFELMPLSLKYESMAPEIRQEFYKKITDAALKRVFDKTTDPNVINQLKSWF